MAAKLQPDGELWQDSICVLCRDACLMHRGWVLRHHHVPPSGHCVEWSRREVFAIQEEVTVLTVTGRKSSTWIRI